MICHRITILRKRSKMSQLQLAKILHVSASTIGMYEQGRRVPSLDILTRMAQVFNVSLDYLIIGTDFTPSSTNIELSHSVESYPCNTCYWKEYPFRYKK